MELIDVKCSFCLNEYKTSLKIVNRNGKPSACVKCRSLAAAYSIGNFSCDRHEFYKSRRPSLTNVDVQSTINKFGYDPSSVAPGSKKLVVAKCEFCLNSYETKINNLKNSVLNACKKCDSIASSYSRTKQDGPKHDYYLARSKVDLSKIDAELTVITFGYDPSSLNIFSTKKVVAICNYCDSRIHIAISKYTSRNADIACKKCIRTKTINTLQRKYGVGCTLSIPSVQYKLRSPKTEQIVKSILEGRYKIEYTQHYSIGPYEFDFYIPSLDLLIECHGDYFHDFKNNGYSGLPKDRAKSSYIENNTSCKLVWLWEHELHIGRINKILDFHIHGIIESKIEFKLDDLIFKKITNAQAHAFLASYHYLGNVGCVASSFGAFYGDELICVSVFGGVTRNQTIKKVNKLTNNSFGPKTLRELRRFCIRPNVDVKNVASYCLARFLKQLDPVIGAVVSFSDSSVGDIGTIYKASNWLNISKTCESYHYIDPNSNKHIHKKTIWDLAVDAHMKESEFVSSTGLIKVKESPKDLWFKKL